MSFASYINHMNIPFAICYEALRSRDRRFDGRFFVGVSSTGVYCRPVCPARLPKIENCTFHPTAAAAEEAGFRPCLRCRPELAPGHSHVDRPDSLTARAVAAMEAGALEQGSLADLAQTLGVTDRHLRRILQERTGVTPKRYEVSRRLRLARQLIRQTTLSMTVVALQCGFSSVRAFNTQFRKVYGTQPSALRRDAAIPDAEAMRLRLGYRPPYDWESILAFLEQRAIAGVEYVAEGTYWRSVRLQDARGGLHTGWIAVSADTDACVVDVRISHSLSAVLVPVLRRVRSLFDLDCQPMAVAQTLGNLASGYEGVRLPGAFDAFEMSVRAILGQQVTVKAAHTLAGRVAASFGDAVETPCAAVTRLFPSASAMAALSADALGQLGIVRQRSSAILALAQEVAHGRLRLAPSEDADGVREALLALPGIGPWTAEYIAMRALHWPDAFPHSDLGVLKGMGVERPAEALHRAEVWRPWRSYAVMHLWRRYAALQKA